MLTDGTLDYVYGPTGTPIEQYTPGGTSPAFYFNDAHGSTTALTGSTGTVVATYSYNPQGKTTAHTGTIATPLQFGGQYSDSETGFTYLRARYYDPATALFISVDAVVASTLSAYIFGSNNPLNRSDPTGLDDWYNPWSRGAQSWATAGTVGIGIGMIALAATGFGLIADGVGLGIAGMVEAGVVAESIATAVEGVGTVADVTALGAGGAGGLIDTGACAIHHDGGACAAAILNTASLGMGGLGHGIARGGQIGARGLLKV